MPKDRKQDPRYKPFRQEYERNRKTILATQEICAICGKIGCDNFTTGLQKILFPNSSYKDPFVLSLRIFYKKIFSIFVNHKSWILDSQALRSRVRISLESLEEK